MDREPWILYLLRLGVAAGLFGFMLLLYWSSLLLEENLQQVKGSLGSVERQIEDLRTTLSSLRGQTLAAPAGEQEQMASTPGNPDYENLLTPDPFYEQTLPEMLGSGFVPKGTLRYGTVGKPSDLHPFSGWAGVSEWQGRCLVSPSALHFGIYETMAPEAAAKIEERASGPGGSSEFWVFLRRDLFWAPMERRFFEDVTLSPHFLQRHPVTAHDFKFGYDAVMNPWVEGVGAVARRTNLVDIEEVRVIDDYTFVVRWKAEGGRPKYQAKLSTGAFAPLASFVYQYFADGSKIVSDDSDPDTYRNNSVWAQNFNRHWARNVIPSCGPMLFDGMTDRQISFRRNPDYFNPYACLIERMEVRFKDSPDALWQDFKIGEADIYELGSAQIAEWRRFQGSDTYLQQKKTGRSIHELTFVGYMFSYLGWNESNILFQDPEVRRALTMAINRKRIVEKNLNGLGMEIHGSIYPFSKASDPDIKPWPFDPERAKLILERAGWFDQDGDGIIDKVIDGKLVPFRCKLTYFVKSPTAKELVEYISSALRDVGISCTGYGVDIADLSRVFDDRTFDALLLAWTYGAPPPNIRQIWHSDYSDKPGSSNAIGFSNQDVDEIIDKLEYTYDQGERLRLYHRFEEILHEEQPYTFLYTPKQMLLYRDRVQNVFVPLDRQDLIPGANIGQPLSSAFYLRE